MDPIIFLRLKYKIQEKKKQKIITFYALFMLINYSAKVFLQEFNFFSLN